MSNSTCDRMLSECHGSLKDLLAQEGPVKPVWLEKDLLRFLTPLYVKYLQLFRKLEWVYDQMLHPQKRRMVRQVLDGVMGRLVEIKHQLVDTQLSEYHYMDDLLQDLKLTPVNRGRRDRGQRGSSVSRG
ncbi:dynein regulatory complex protein 11-like [Ascaphus truei]|uniref:dynein regulatory complex protein 11-like n=1 Tax=Ascaphus truei TaxID=8439 RepID=UPI003F5ABA40